MNPLKSKHYATFMYIAITIITLAIILNLTSIFNNYVNSNIELKSRLEYNRVTARVIGENINPVINNTNTTKENTNRNINELYK